MKSFIEGLKSLEGYRGQIAHIEFLPAKKQESGELEYFLPSSLRQYLRTRSIELYKHQADAINLIRKGENVVIATPTASGKTLAFNLPVFETLRRNPKARALYIYPMKALENDQLNTLSIMEKETGIIVNPKIYDGDTLRQERNKIRKESRIILTNPYGLHYYLPWHHLWKKFYANIKYIIVDESHTYRGVFGSHVALLFRRINRICNYYGSDPQYILSSATIANPEEHSEKLIGKKFHVITDDSSETGTKSFIFWNPPYTDDNVTRESTHQETRRLVNYCVSQGFQTLCFAPSRKMAELIALWVKEDLSDNPNLSEAVRSYRAGYLPKERREIERGLKQRRISCVVTTNALELGIDIGSLDCVIMSGYPGTVISTWQQAGRAGRLIDDSVVFLVAFQNPLDQYFMKHPQEFFKRSPENAVINLENPYITTGHVMCASNELALKESDIEYFSKSYNEAVNELHQSGQIRRYSRGYTYSGYPRPETRVKLNSISDQTVTVLFGNKVLETMDITQAYREAHEGAILLHQGEPYLVKSLDLNLLEAKVEETGEGYYTEALKTVDIYINEKIDEREHDQVKTGLGRVKVTEYYNEYRKMLYEKKIDQQPLNLPPLNFPSIGFWFTVPSTIASSIRRRGLDLAGGLHAVEHAIIAISPLHAMCDTRDLGGVSTELHRDTMEPTIIVYDAYRGGIGLSEKLYTLMPDLFHTTLKLIQDCECDAGCPSCIYSSKCGNNNEPLDKETAIILLEEILKQFKDY